MEGAAHYEHLRVASAAASKGEDDLCGRLAALCSASDREPQRSDLHNNIGLLLQTLQRPEDAIACFDRALTLQPSYAIALNNRGLCLSALGRRDEARTSYVAALALEPRYSEAANNLGTLLHMSGNLVGALEQLRAAVSSRPNFAEARVNLAHVLAELGSPGEAALEYERVIEFHGETADLRGSLGTAYLAHGQYDAALLAFERAMVLDPNQVEACAGLASIHLHFGRLDWARAGFAKAATLEPGRPRHLLNLARATRFVQGSPHVPRILAMETALVTFAEEDRIDAHFTLAKVFDDLGEPDRAFRHLIAGNALKRGRTTYDAAQVKSTFALIRQKFTQAVVGRPAGGKTAPGQQTPVFIVGMPRSGSTLVEQILAAHPRVGAVGEVDYLEAALRRVRSETTGTLFSGCALDPDDPQIALFRRHYADLLFGARDLQPGAAIVTDKMLSNFRFLGLIHLAFPDAPIIHTVRDPVDTCLSCFGVQFASLPFTYDLAELGGYYREYSTLMGHWRAVLPPGRILDVPYESVVSGFEGQVRRMLDFCGLDWSDLCLRFQDVDRPVKTASISQVRQPLYATSVGRWRPPTNVLAPLIRAFGDAGQD